MPTSWGKPSIIDAIAEAQKARPSLFVRGAVTASSAAGEFHTAITGGDSAPHKHQKGDPPLPEDYRVIHARGITQSDAFGQWEAELNQAGHAVIHDKIVVIDPFSDTCVVITGSHNLGYRASYNNDENLAIIRNHRAVAKAYAAHCLDVYDHYAWRFWLATEGDKAWRFLAADDAWQNAYFSPGKQGKSAELNFLARRQSRGGRAADAERRRLDSRETRAAGADRGNFSGQRSAFRRAAAPPAWAAAAKPSQRRRRLARLS